MGRIGIEFDILELVYHPLYEGFGIYRRVVVCGAAFNNVKYL